MGSKFDNDVQKLFRKGFFFLSETKFDLGTTSHNRNPLQSSHIEVSCNSFPSKQIIL